MSVPGAASHRGFEDTELDALHAVFAEVIHTLERYDVPYAVVGGLASAALGRPRASADVDVLVMPQDARRALGVLGDAGFAIDETNPYCGLRRLLPNSTTSTRTDLRPKRFASASFGM